MKFLSKIQPFVYMEKGIPIKDQVKADVGIRR